MPQAEKPDSTTTSRRRFLAAAPVIAVGIGGPWASASPASSEDAELIELGRQLAKISERETSAWAIYGPDEETANAIQIAAKREGDTVLAKMMALQAVTLEGLGVKARAALWAVGAFDGPEAAEHLIEEPSVVSLIFDTVSAAEKLHKAMQS